MFKMAKVQLYYVVPKEVYDKVMSAKAPISLEDKVETLSEPVRSKVVSLLNRLRNYLNYDDYGFVNQPPKTISEPFNIYDPVLYFVSGSESEPSNFGEFLKYILTKTPVSLNRIDKKVKRDYKTKIENWRR